MQSKKSTKWTSHNGKKAVTLAGGKKRRRKTNEGLSREIKIKLTIERMEKRKNGRKDSRDGERADLASQILSKELHGGANGSAEMTGWSGCHQSAR